MEIQVTDQQLLATQTAGTTAESPAETTSTAQGNFSDFFLSALGRTSADSVNEEELFAALIEQKLGDHSSEAQDFYRSKKSEYMSSMARPDGYVNVEEVAKKALMETASAGHIEQTDAETINGIAFAAAQLDDNLNALYDSRGSAGDSTVATSSLADALGRMERALEEIENGTTTVDPKPIDNGGETVPVGNGTTEIDGAEGFLWKPVSESDGNLVVLLPTELKGLIDRAEIHNGLPADESTKVAEGRFAGDDHNGNRPHFRFDQPGASFGQDLYLVAYKSDGEMLSWEITDGALRHD